MNVEITGYASEKDCTMVTYKELLALRKCRNLNRFAYQRIEDYVDNLIWKNKNEVAIQINYSDVQKMLKSTTISLSIDEIYEYLKIYAVNSEFEFVFTESYVILSLTYTL